MRFRTLALALALCCGAGTMVQAATINAAAKAARKRSKHNAKVIAKRSQHRGTSKVAKGKGKSHKKNA